MSFWAIAVEAPTFLPTVSVTGLGMQLFASSSTCIHIRGHRCVSCTSVCWVSRLREVGTGRRWRKK